MRPHPRIRTTITRVRAVPSGLWPMIIPIVLAVCTPPAGILVVGPRALGGVAAGAFIYFVLAIVALVTFLCRRTARSWVMAGVPAIAFAAVQTAILIDHALDGAATPPAGPHLPDSITPDALTGGLLAVAAALALAAIACWEALVGVVLAVRFWRRPRSGTCPRCDYDRIGLAAGAKCPECGSAAP